MNINDVDFDKTNKIIADFMHRKPDYWYVNNLMSYHFDWGKLMPVVEKIEELGHAVEIVQENVIIYDHDSKGNLDEIINGEGESKLESIYDAVLKFIEWYKIRK